MTTIGPTIVISGDIASGEDVMVQGHVSGTLVVREADLIVGEQAQLHADIRGARVLVQGHLKGSIVASERIELTAVATVEGTLSANRVVLADGARFNGSIDMDRRTLVAKIAQFKATYGGDRPTTG